MGYRIDYGPVKKVRRAECRTSRLAALTGLFLLLFVVSVCCFWPEGAAVLRDWLLPGDRAVTAAALEEMTGALRSGEHILDALSRFFRKLLEGVGIVPAG